MDTDSPLPPVERGNLAASVSRDVQLEVPPNDKINRSAFFWCAQTGARGVSLEPLPSAHTDTVAAVFTCTHCNAVPERVVDGKAAIAIVRHKIGCPTLMAQTRTRWPAQVR
jgi:hypothetical protein